MSAFTEANRQAFNNLSATYNTKAWQHDISNQVAEALQDRKEWIGASWIDASKPLSNQPEVKLLDYACGTGSITQALGSSVSRIVGVDVSENMVAVYNETAQTSGLSTNQTKAVVGDLCGETPTPGLDGPDFQEFDIAIIGLGFHHFEDPARAIKRLAERLKAGSGVLVIIDFLPSSKSATDKKHDFPDMAHTIKHNGFTGDQMRDLYGDAGFVDFDIVALKKPTIMELKTGTVERTMFVAKGRKSATVWQRLASWVGGVQDVASGQMQFGKDGSEWNHGAQTEQGQDWGQKLGDDSQQNESKQSWSGFEQK